MKKLSAALIIIAICFSFSCRRGDKTEIVIEETTAEKIDLPEKVKVVIDLKNIREGVVAFQTMQNRFPESLDELDLDLNCPGEYDYDSQKGVVKSKSYPDL
jgi:hypothetical protein